MPIFSLTLNIDAENLKQLVEAGEKIVIVKAPTGSNPVVAWVVFQPFEANQVAWTPDYALYAQPTKGVVSSIVTTEFPTPSGVAYKFEGNGQFQLAEKELFPPVGSYRVFDELPPAVAADARFGLVQEASVNGTTSRERINAVVVPSHQLAEFTPDDTVIVWLQSNVSVGDAVTVPPPVTAPPSAATKTTVMSRSTTIRFGGSYVDATYRYDPSVGGFVPAEKE